MFRPLPVGKTVRRYYGGIDRIDPHEKSTLVPAAVALP
jgi:hypothetical protein